MAFSATTRRIERVLVVSCTGKLLFGEEAKAFRLLVQELLKESPRIVLDLSEVTHIDSGGLGVLVAAYISARKVGGNVKLARPGPHTKDALRITRLSTVFEIFDSADDAAASFAPIGAAA